jgi:hypothetical protein
MSYTKSIEEFRNQINKITSEIESINNDSFKRILYLILLDALAKSRYPNEKENKKKFVDFIDNYSGWDLKNRYSIRQLELLINSDRFPKNVPDIVHLRAVIKSRLEKWPQHSGIFFPKEVDPTREELFYLFNPKLFKQIEKVRYPSLLWKLRNSLVHEFRNKGEGFDFKWNGHSPYYHKVIIGNFETWVLFFPTNLFSELINTSKRNLWKYFDINNKDPWTSFPYAYEWFI